MKPRSRILDHIDPPAKRNIVVDKAKQLKLEAKELRLSNKESNAELRGIKADLREPLKQKLKLEKLIAKTKLRLERIKELLAK